ncbi:MAG: plastocyanin/azurin family copper-binding protein [Actinomycetota bacterium]|nr:plastocyanin/azurin family copper-binding protein [Actinomycetota bacterium]
MRSIALLLALFTFSCAPASGSERTVVLNIEHSSFGRDHLTFHKGEMVRFVLRNGDPIDHELIIGDAAVQQLHESGTETHHDARPGEVSVAAGATAETTYTFSEPGTLLFGCHLPRHYRYGMRGTIRVDG